MPPLEPIRAEQEWAATAELLDRAGTRPADLPEDQEDAG